MSLAVEVVSETIIECPHAELCSGCPLIALPYGEQLARKRALVVNALQGYADLQAVSVSETLGAKLLVGYRVRAKLAVQGKALGLYGAGTHAVVDIPQCRILEPRVARVVARLRAQLPFEFPLYAVDVRAVDGGALVTLIVSQQVQQDALLRVAQQLQVRDPEVLGVAWSLRATGSAQLLGGRPQPLVGLAAAPHHFDPEGPFHQAVPGAFVQAHAGQALRLQTAIEHALDGALGSLEGRRILELYAGSGSLALRLAAQGVRVTAVDSFEPGLSCLAQAAEAQGLSVGVWAVPAERALQDAGPLDAVIVDPPRRGVSPEVRRLLAASSATIIIYVSCSPRTWARDLADLSQRGLTANAVLLLDMIPLSDGVETVTVLRRGPLPLPRVLFRDESLVAVDKRGLIPTIPQGEHPQALLDSVRRLPGCGRAVPVHRLDIGTSGVCLFAITPERVLSLAEALAQGEKQYLALVRGMTRKAGRLRRGLREGAQVRQAETRYRRLQVVGTHSLLRVSPQQGRKHQIRRHLAGMGHPVLGDTRYGDLSSNRHFEERHGLDRTFLHCAAILLPGRAVIESALSADLQSVLASVAGAS